MSDPIVIPEVPKVVWKTTTICIPVSDQFHGYTIEIHDRRPHEIGPYFNIVDPNVVMHNKHIGSETINRFIKYHWEDATYCIKGAVCKDGEPVYGNYYGISTLNHGDYSVPYYLKDHSPCKFSRKKALERSYTGY